MMVIIIVASVPIRTIPPRLPDTVDEDRRDPCWLL